MNKIMLAAAVGSIAFASPLMAQGRGRGNDGVPPGQRPPAGLCRVWIDGVPPGRQPAPTDCATANATRPANARIIYGSDSRAPNGNRGIYNGNGTISNGNRSIYNGGVSNDGIYNGSRGVYQPNDDDRARREYDRARDDHRKKEKHKHKGHGPRHDRD
jgi:hypothetical protein